MFSESARQKGVPHLVSAVVQSVLLMAVAGVLLSAAQRLPTWLIVVGGVLGGIPALISIQRAWIEFLWDRKLVAARQFARRKPWDLSAQYELGLLEASRGRNEEAQRAFEAALAIQPDHAPSLVGHGHVAAQLGDLGTALKYFKDAAGIDSDLFSAHFGMGTIYQAREQYARSIKSFKEALRVDPNDGPTLAELARCYLALGDPRQARHYHARAMASGFKDHELTRTIRDA
jgi:tetratricopeptide (TPR) repeat protein